MDCSDGWHLQNRTKTLEEIQSRLRNYYRTSLYGNTELDCLKFITLQSCLLKYRERKASQGADTKSFNQRKKIVKIYRKIKMGWNRATNWMNWMSLKICLRQTWAFYCLWTHPTVRVGQWCGSVATGGGAATLHNSPNFSCGSLGKLIAHPWLRETFLFPPPLLKCSW